MLSIIEIIIYGFVTYFSLGLLIMSVMKEMPSGRSQSAIRVVFFATGVIAAFMLAGSTDVINIETTTTTIFTNETTYNETSDLIFTVLGNATETDTNLIYLQNEMWVMWHYMLGMIFMFFILIQILNLLTKT